MVASIFYSTRHWYNVSRIVYRDRYLNAPGWLGRWRSSWPQRRCVIQRPTRRPFTPTHERWSDRTLCCARPNSSCVCLECPTLVSGSGVLALRCRTSRRPCRVEFNTRSTTLVTHDAGGRYNILFQLLWLIRNDCSSRDTRSRGCTANLRHKIAKGAVAQDSEHIRSCRLSH